MNSESSQAPTNAPGTPLVDLWEDIEARMGVCPSFFKLARAEPSVARGLFDLAKFAYLDSPLPAEFKEKLFTFLSRFCPTRYCVTRHAAFLLGYGYSAGDPTAQVLSPSEVISIIAAPLPDKEEVAKCLTELKSQATIDDWPGYESPTGQLLVTACTQIFLQPQRAKPWTSAVRHLLGPGKFEQLMLYLAFIRTAHFWTEVHPELELEDDVEALLSEQEALASQLKKGADDADRTLLGSQLQEELVELRETKKLTEELQRREQILQLAAEAAGMAIAEIDYHTLTAVLDQVAGELYGLPHGRPIPRSDIHDLFHEDDREELEQLYTRALDPESGGDLRSTYRIVRPDGEIRWISVRKRIEFAKHDQVLVPKTGIMVAIDVTEQHLAEKAVRESEERFRATFENAAVGIAHIGLDGRWLRVNDRFSDIIGYPHGEILAPSFSDPTHPSDSAADQAQWHKLLAGEVAKYSIEKRYLHKSGESVWVNLTVSLVRDSAGKPEYAISVAEIIAQRKQAEERERQLMADAMELNAKFQAMFRQSTIMAGVMTLDGTFIEANDICLDACGYEADQELGRPFWECGWWRGLPEVQEKLKRATAAAAKGESFREELPYMWADDSEHTSDFALHPIRNEAGEVIFLFPTGMDITERKENEQRLRHARDVAEAANRSRGEFLANMSHEIRTPMTAILGHADILSQHLQNPDDLQNVQTIRRNGKFLLEIINDILDLSKIDAGRLEIEKEPMSLEATIGEIRSLLDVRAGEGNVRLEFEFNSKIPAKIETDAVRLRQILLNLIGNAIKFSDHGLVRVVIGFLADANQMRFDIIDNGIGISSDELSQLFEPFTQADASTTRKFGGTGLGLTISQRLATALDGKISVDSKLGKGSTFTLTIACGDTGNVPLIQPSLDASQGDDDQWEDVVINGRILVVDDRRDIRHLAQHFIEQAGGEVVVATDGVEALAVVETAERDQSPVDLVIMDMQMPVMDGYTAAKRLRASGFERPIIALTANAMKEDRERCLAAGCDDYVAKPLDGQLLTQLVARYLDRGRA